MGGAGGTTQSVEGLNRIKRQRGRVHLFSLPELGHPSSPALGHWHSCSQLSGLRLGCPPSALWVPKPLDSYTAGFPGSQPADVRSCVWEPAINLSLSLIHPQVQTHISHWFSREPCEYFCTYDNMSNTTGPFPMKSELWCPSPTSLGATSFTHFDSLVMISLNMNNN